MSFLGQHEVRSLSIPELRGLRPLGLVLGHGAGGLEVAVTESSTQPSVSDLRAVWRARQAGRATPVILVVLYPGHAAICGPGGEQPPAYLNLDPGKVERLCATALSEPDRHAALRFLHTAIPEIDAPISGLRNEGFFATHELQVGVPRREDWAKAGARATPALKMRGQALVRALGFTVSPLPGPAAVLIAADTKVAVAVFLERDEAPDVASTRYSGLSPVSYALATADTENLPYVIVTAGPVIRLYATRMGIGPGRRGRTETFAELHLDLLADGHAAYLWLLFSADALRRGGSVEDILARSADYAADLGARLRERIYTRVIPPMAEAIVATRELRKPSAQDLTETYQMALAILFRLLFVAYAEDKELLPYRTNALYRARSLKQKARELLTVLQSGGGFDDGTAHWEEIDRLCRAVDQGNREWGVPAYNGGLFSSDPDVSPIGAALTRVALRDKVLGPILADLLLDETPEGRGPVDFRTLGVREFGTIYEGLLENELSVADIDLAVEESGAYRPATRTQDVVVRAGGIYLHNASGARKATGSYFTKPFAVDHLLDHALEPALSEHLRRLDALDERQASEAFFDFRVADIAMGSAHFLVAAVDRIERAFSGYLARRPLPRVREELARLRKSAETALGPLGEGVDIEDTQLLRRQIARRCIYGVDLNPTAVELARLSLWIHTFVPGLPLTFLDHNLVCGNSLVGMATITEAQEYLSQASGSLYALSTEALVGDSRTAIERLGRLADADAAELRRARIAFREARDAVAPAEALFDILSAARLDDALRRQIAASATHWVKRISDLPDSRPHREAQKVLGSLHPLHFPIAFPEVFLRERSGFDVILGNPPWEEATLEEDRFWTRFAPGFHSLPQREQEAAKRRYRRDRPDLVKLYETELERAALLRRVLTSGPFPGMGTGDPDLYKAFGWRFWQLACASGGRIGVVLPRSLFAAKGSEPLRRVILSEGRVEDLTMLLNNKGWVFDDVHPQFTIALAGVNKERPDKTTAIALRGPYRSLEGYRQGMGKPPARFASTEAASWTDAASLPLLPAEDSAEVFARLRQAPRLDFNRAGAWRARPHAELHATNDKGLMTFSKTCPAGFWPVYKGESFDIWNPDTGSYYGWANSGVVMKALQVKRLRSARTDRSAFGEFDPRWIRDVKTLSCLHPRIAFRDVARATDSRTVRAALIPPKVFITNKGPFFL